jgi:hypothetical protein
MTFYDNTEFVDPAWLARHGDPQTSQQAAARLNRGQISIAICDEIVRLLRVHGPLTDAQLVTLLMDDYDIGRYVTPSGMRTRRKRLERSGILYDTGRRTPGETGRLAICWGLVSIVYHQSA